MTSILGISCDYHDAAAALVVDGEIVAAAEEERFSRVKHDSSLPARAVASCLAIGGIDASDLDAVVFHEKPLVVANRVLAARQRLGPSAVPKFVREMPLLLRRNLLIAYRVEQMLRSMGADDPPPLTYCEHHLSHAAAAFYPSPFDTAAVLTVDGIGEWSTATIGHGSHHRIDPLAEQRYPHSLGLLYSLATAWCGFEPNDGEYKLMGLAPFGTARYRDALDRLVDVHEDGSITLDVRALRWWSRRPDRLRRLSAWFDGPPRGAGQPPTQRDADLARSVQELTEEVVLRMARHALAVTGESRLCLAGGVALNCVANGRLRRETGADIWVQPAAGDAGSAAGAALWHWHGELGRDRPPRSPGPSDGFAGALLGPSFDDDEIVAWVAEACPSARRYRDRSELDTVVSQRLEEGAIVGWFQGRMEFGPRALGNRSILADPRSTTVQREINLRVKGRESFRPFAPAVLWEHAAEWFDIDAPSPYMLFTFPVTEGRRVEVDVEPTDFVERVQVPRSSIPACTHVDGSARVQTVHADVHPRLHSLLEAFHARTGCPVLLNTSFNRAGDPIVANPDDALATAREAGLDVLVVGDHLIEVPAP